MWLCHLVFLFVFTWSNSIQRNNIRMTNIDHLIYIDKIMWRLNLSQYLNVVRFFSSSLFINWFVFYHVDYTNWFTRDIFQTFVFLINTSSFSFFLPLNILTIILTKHKTLNTKQSNKYPFVFRLQRFIMKKMICQ